MQLLNPDRAPRNAVAPAVFVFVVASLALGAYAIGEGAQSGYDLRNYHWYAG